MIVFGIGDVFGIISTIISDSIFIPSWAWFTIAGIAILIAMFLAFHKVRKERDKCIEGINLTVEELEYLNKHRIDLELGVDNNGIVDSITSVLITEDMVEVKYRRTSSGPREYDQRYLILTPKAKKILIWADVMNKKEIHNAKT